MRTFSYETRSQDKPRISALEVYEEELTAKVVVDVVDAEPSGGVMRVASRTAGTNELVTHVELDATLGLNGELEFDLTTLSVESVVRERLYKMSVTAVVDGSNYVVMTGSFTLKESLPAKA